MYAIWTCRITQSPELHRAYEYFVTLWYYRVAGLDCEYSSNSSLYLQPGADKGCNAFPEYMITFLNKALTAGRNVE